MNAKFTLPDGTEVSAREWIEAIEDDDTVPEDQKLTAHAIVNQETGTQKENAA